MSEPPHKTKTPNPPMPLIIPTMSYIDEPTRSFEESTTNSRKRKGTPQSNLTLSDCQQCIRDALAEKRISYNKANRLHDCLNSESLTEVIYKLLCEQIPNKRSKTSGGYKCKLCALPLKGHICVYCPVCSTPEEKYTKDSEHSCFNCAQCFEAGKRMKKVVQIKIGTGDCPHGREKGYEAAAALLGFSGTTVNKGSLKKA